MSANMLDQINGIEGIEMNFYGSQDASDADISFRNISYYQVFTPKSATKQPSSNQATNNFGGSEPGTGSINPSTPADPSSSDPTPSILSPDSSISDTPVDSEVVKSDLANGTPLTTLDPTPEPRYSAIALLMAGLAIGVLRKLQQRRRQVL